MLSTPLLLSWLAVATPTPAAPPPPAAATSVYSLEEAAFVVQAREDLQVLERDAQALGALREQLTQTRALYTRSQDIPYSPDEKRTLLSTWAAFSENVIVSSRTFGSSA